MARLEFANVPLKVWETIAAGAIWNRMVLFANTDLSSVEPSARTEDFVELAKSCAFFKVGFSWKCREISAAKEGDESITALTGYQNNIKQVLRWLVDPAQAEYELANEALQFLEQNLKGIKRSFAVSDSFDPKRRGRAFYIETPIEFPSIVSPICEFMWKQMERYRAGDGELKEIIPIGLCKKPGCGRFFLIERIGRGSYCSSRCRASYWQSTHLAERREKAHKRQQRKKHREQKRLDTVKSESRKSAKKERK